MRQRVKYLTVRRHNACTQYCTQGYSTPKMQTPSFTQRVSFESSSPKVSVAARLSSGLDTTTRNLAPDLFLYGDPTDFSYTTESKRSCPKGFRPLRRLMPHSENGSRCLGMGALPLICTCTLVPAAVDPSKERTPVHFAK